MGVLLALLAMASFATNIILTRYAVARMPVESGFFIVLATNILFPALVYPFEVAVRTAPVTWDWKGVGIFALGGIIGTFLGRRFLFDAVQLLGPSRASVFHSTSPAFALVGAWLLVGERLGWYEIGLMAVVWLGLWLTQPRAGAAQVTVAIERRRLAPGTVRVGMRRRAVHHHIARLGPTLAGARRALSCPASLVRMGRRGSPGLSSPMTSSTRCAGTRPRAATIGSCSGSTCGSPTPTRSSRGRAGGGSTSPGASRSGTGAASATSSGRSPSR